MYHLRNIKCSTPPVVEELVGEIKTASTIPAELMIVDGPSYRYKNDHYTDLSNLVLVNENTTEYSGTYKFDYYIGHPGEKYSDDGLLYRYKRDDGKTIYITSEHTLSDYSEEFVYAIVDEIDETDTTYTYKLLLMESSISEKRINISVPEWVRLENHVYYYSYVDYAFGFLYEGNDEGIAVGLNGKDNYINLYNGEPITEFGDPYPTVSKPFVIRYEDALIDRFEFDGNVYYYIGKMLSTNRSLESWTYYFSTKGNDSIKTFEHRNPTSSEIDYSTITTYGDVILYYSPYKFVDNDQIPVITICSPDRVLTEPPVPSE